MQERVSLLTALLPEDPEPNQVIVMPEGQLAGASNVIYLYSGETLIGTSSSFVPISNVSRKGALSRAVTTKKIKRGNTLRVEYVQLNYRSVMFVQFFGWIGHDIESQQLLSSKTYKVLHVLPLNDKVEGFNLYEQICLDGNEEKKK
jgi:hypothetical protein